MGVGSKSGAHGGWRDEEVDSLPDTGIEEDLPPHRTLATAELHPRLKKPRMNSCCASIFGTKQLSPNNDRTAYIRATLIELLIYLVYLTVCCFIVYGTISTNGYYYTKVLSDLFLDTPFNDKNTEGTIKTFRSSSDVKDFWKFTETAMPNGLYWEDWYDDPMLKQTVSVQDQGILYENRILGLPRLRQIRVSTMNCPIGPPFRDLKECYPHYDTDYEDKGAYSTTQTGTAWKYYNEKELETRQYWGKLGIYSGSGAYVLLGTKKQDTASKIAVLKKNLWITRATRIVLLEFTVYNANLNLFCVVRLAWEFPATGGLVTSWSFRNIRLFRYISSWDYFIFACEILFIIFTVYYTIQELIEMFSLGPRRYLSDMWSYLDLILLSLSYVCIAFSIYRQYLVAETVKPLFSKPNGFAEFEYLAFWETQFVNGIAICLFFSWIKIFKYISINKTMSQLSTTLSRCSKDIMGFAVMFFIVFFAFSQLGYLLFGSQVRNFSSFQDSVLSLLRLLLGDFEFREIEAANRVLGPIFYLAYVFFVFFVLLNMFLAIINDTYSEVKAEVDAQRDEFQITDFVKQRLNFFRRKASQQQSHTENSAAADGKITQIELKSHLIRANYSGEEIDLFLARYALDKDVPLDEEETENLIAELNDKNEAGSDSEDYNMKGDAKPYTEVSESARMDKRITAMESTLTELIGRLDSIISKIPS